MAMSGLWEGSGRWFSCSGEGTGVNPRLPELTAVFVLLSPRSIVKQLPPGSACPTASAWTSNILQLMHDSSTLAEEAPQTATLRL